MITNKRPKLFSVVAALSMLIQSSALCFAANAPGVSDSATEIQSNSNQIGSQVVNSSKEKTSVADGSSSGKFSVLQAIPADLAVLDTVKNNALKDSSKQLVSSASIPAVGLRSEQAPVSVAEAALPADTYSVLRGGVAVSPSAAQGKIDDLARQILLKICELERYNIHYDINVAKQGRWKGWRYGGLQIVNNSLGLTGAIIGTAERGTHIHNPTHIHNEFQEQANWIPMIGSIIGATAAAMELGINEYHDIEAKKHGYGPKEAVAHVNGIRDDINRLLAERDALIGVEASDANLSAHVEVDRAEGKILRDLRDESLQEFERFHISRRRLFAFEQCQYLFDISKYTVNAIGYEMAALSLHLHHRYNNGRAGVLFDIAGPLYMTGPIISRIYAKSVAEHYRKILRPTTQDAEATKVDQLVADHALLDRLTSLPTVPSGSVKGVVDRSAMYGTHEKTFQDELRSSEKDRSKAKLSATQNIGSGLYVGATKLAQGILFTIVGFNHNYNQKNDDFRASRVTNSNLFVGSVISIPSSTYSILDTLRIQVQGEINRKKLKDAGMLPSQLQQARLNQLEVMEARLGGIK